MHCLTDCSPHFRQKIFMRCISQLFPHFMQVIKIFMQHFNQLFCFISRHKNPHAIFPIDHSHREWNTTYKISSVYHQIWRRTKNLHAMFQSATPTLHFNHKNLHAMLESSIPFSNCFSSDTKTFMQFCQSVIHRGIQYNIQDLSSILQR